MNTDEKTYPSWIKYFLGITATLGLFKAFTTFFTNMMLYDTVFAITTFIGSILLFISVILIINKKFYGYVCYIVLLLCEYPLSLYFFGRVNEKIYYAIFVRLILMSFLVFIPFKRSRSLFQAMMPIDNPFKKIRRIHLSKRHTIKPVTPDNNNTAEIIAHSNINEKTVTRKHKFKFNPRVVKIGLWVVCAVGICAGAFYSLSFIFKEDSHGGYFIDENNLIHTNANCSAIEKQSELILSDVLYQQAISPQNITLPQHGMRYCGKCFNVSEIHQFQDSVKSFTQHYWGTLDADSLTMLAKDIEWFFNHFENKYQWKNEVETLLYFKNFDNALGFYKKNCKDWSLGSPKEFLSLLAPLFSKQPNANDVEYLTRRKYVYEILRDNNYEMEDFNDYLNHISDPVRRERLYHTLITDEGCYDVSVPLKSYSAFQSWMGY